MPRMLVLSAFLVYMAGVVALYLQFGDQLIWLSFLVVVNMACLLIIGNYLLRSILFPYSNFFIKKQLDSVINRRFSQEFGRLLQQVHKCLRIMAELDGPETFAEFKKKQTEKEEAGPGKNMKIDERDPNKPPTDVSFSASEGSNKELSNRDRKRITQEIN